MDGLLETGFGAIGGGDVLMIAIGILLVYLGIAKKWEPFLLVPIGFSIVLVNLPLGGLLDTTGGDLLDKDSEAVGMIAYIFKGGIQTDLIPCLIFICLGSMTDFEPLIANPKTLILGAAAQFGVYITLIVAVLIGSGWLGITDWGLKEACTIGIIGGADGPTTIYLSDKLAPHLMGTVAMAAYIYMAMVPIIQPPIIKLCTTKKERQIYMKPVAREISRKEKILFPFVGAIIIILLVPKSAPLIGSFMFGNLLYISGVTDRLGKTARESFMDILTIFLGLSIGGIMTADNFLKLDSILAFVLGIFAFASATAFGVLMARLMNKFSREPINPMIGAAGVSAVPMSARVVQIMGQKANPQNFLLMHAMGPNIAGVIGTATAAGIFLSMLE